jgi:hypothetical protein
VTKKPIATAFSLSGIENVWVTNFYDCPLRGLCRYRGKLCVYAARYSEDEDKPTYWEIYELSAIEKVRLTLHRWAFELCVGKHWSGDLNNRRPFTGSLNHPLTRLYYWVTMGYDTGRSK